MYLKSIEVQGFKSFANKIVFQFHEGITGIVGPNGSGKSNVADAVRWVLGEQRVRQLRGGTMQDIIFSGTENRKPMGYAFVAITLDNSDHSLPVSYDEVTVARRLYRSGESEYLLNGTQCRLKDVNELFYDTGIGKEGYSIIGQGQIEKILSGKPEERRELFDEAAGIVKYKRRKFTAQKKLEDEQQNLIRVNDILAELSRQLEPMERQAEKARVYLKKKEELKAYDVNMFLGDVERLREELVQTQEKYGIAADDLRQTQEEYEKTRAEYEALETQLEVIEKELKAEQEKTTVARLERQQLESRIALLGEQIKTSRQSREHMRSRFDTLEKDIEDRKQQKAQTDQRQHQIRAKTDEIREQNREAAAAHENLLQQIEACSGQIERCKNEMISLLNERSSVKARQQRFATMIEQLNIRRAQISQQILKLKSQESDQKGILDGLQAEHDGIIGQIRELNEKSAQINEKLDRLQEQLADDNQQIERVQTEYHRDASRLESLRNMTERYDGYGNSIRRVMERKDREKGILGVVADLVKTEKKYEIAIETALGGSIQNIVTEDEDTAKRMIEYLKRNKFGRATFLPLTAMSRRGGFGQDQVLREPGVIGLASGLVSADGKYAYLVEYLLGKTVVTDQIDHAVALARKYRYTLRIVTLEGESLSPGGSMTGGAFRSNSNLLGRRREMEELQSEVEKKKKKMEELRASIDTCRDERSRQRELLVEISDQLQKKYIEQNTVQMKMREVKTQKDQTVSGYQQIRREGEEIEAQSGEMDQEAAGIEALLNESASREQELKTAAEQAAQELEQIRERESRSARELEQVHLQLASLEQEEIFTVSSSERLLGEITAFRREQEQNSAAAGR